MGTHRDHRGQGYGAAICEAAASALRQMGSSRVVVSPRPPTSRPWPRTSRPVSPRARRWRTCVDCCERQSRSSISRRFLSG
ncbi:hypothetical protein [Nocardioides campestrisoli]